MSQAADLLRRRGHRMTVARGALLELFGDRCDPLSAQQAHAKLCERGIRVNAATVYRELSFLAKEGMLRTVRFLDGLARFESASAPHHHHVVCTGCNRVDSVHVDAALCDVSRAVEGSTGFTLVGHALEFFGRCASCSRISPSLP